MNMAAPARVLDAPRRLRGKRTQRGWRNWRNWRVLRALHALHGRRVPRTRRGPQMLLWDAASPWAEPVENRRGAPPWTIQAAGPGLHLAPQRIRTIGGVEPAQARACHAQLRLRVGRGMARTDQNCGVAPDIGPPGVVLRQPGNRGCPRRGRRACSDPDPCRDHAGVFDAPALTQVAGVGMFATRLRRGSQRLSARQLQRHFGTPGA